MCSKDCKYCEIKPDLIIGFWARIFEYLGG
jgi:hypothetical protein